MTALFYFFSGLAILSAVGVILACRPVRALLCLILTMFSLAVLYLLLGAPFVAMVHLIVYAGAVLVLFLFVVMLQGLGAKDLPLPKRFPPAKLVFFLIAGVLFSGIFLFVIQNLAVTGVQPVEGTVEVIGDALFRRYLLPFELTSFILLVGIFAAVALAKENGDLE